MIISIEWNKKISWSELMRRYYDDSDWLCVNITNKECVLL